MLHDQNYNHLPVPHRPPARAIVELTMDADTAAELLHRLVLDLAAHYLEHQPTHAPLAYVLLDDLRRQLRPDPDPLGPIALP